MELNSSLKDTSAIRASKVPNSVKYQKNWESKNIQIKSYSNISILTTKYDDLNEKNNYYEKKSSKINHEDSIFDTLKNRGLLDLSLEKKINEFNQNLTNKKSQCNISKMSLIQEYKIIQKNNSICNTQLENLGYMKEMKNKKIEILENIKNSLKKKIYGDCYINNNLQESPSVNDNIYKNFDQCNLSNKHENLRKESFNHLVDCIKNLKIPNKNISDIIINNNDEELKLESLKLVI